MRLTVLRTTSEKLTRAPVVISPASTTMLSLTRVSAATREVLSCARMASRTASEIWSATLSGCPRSEEHTSELQSRLHLVCRLLLEKKKKKIHDILDYTKKST